MSYCVNCGVELNPGARECPLCRTPVVNPSCPVDAAEPGFFPVRREEVAPVSRREAALLLSAMLLSVAICCGLLNLVFYSDIWWSFFIDGAMAMLWVWFVPPLLVQRMFIWVRLTLDVLAVGAYICLIAIALDGMGWFLGLALPIIAAAVLVIPLLYWIIRTRRCSLLVSAVLVLMAIGLLAVLTEFICDRYLSGGWLPGWSMVVLASCVGLSVPLIIVRRVPSLREEARRKFHM